MQNMYRAQTEVTDAEIAAEMAKNRGEVKDPTTDRERIRKKLESAKIGAIKKDIIDKINAIALKGVNKKFRRMQGILRQIVQLIERCLQIRFVGLGCVVVQCIPETIFCKDKQTPVSVNPRPLVRNPYNDRLIVHCLGHCKSLIVEGHCLLFVTQFVFDAPLEVECLNFSNGIAKCLEDIDCPLDQPPGFFRVMVVNSQVDGLFDPLVGLAVIGFGRLVIISRLFTLPEFHFDFLMPCNDLDCQTQINRIQPLIPAFIKPLLIIEHHDYWIERRKTLFWNIARLLL